jgi:hypothetical protein
VLNPAYTIHLHTPTKHGPNKEATTINEESLSRHQCRAQPEKRQGCRPKCKLCRREHTDKTPCHLQRATRRRVQGGVKKSTTQDRRHCLIRRSWVFTRSTQEDQEKPLRCLQEGDGVQRCLHRCPERPRQGFPLGKISHLPTHGTEHRLNGNQIVATEHHSPVPMPPS